MIFAHIDVTELDKSSKGGCAGSGAFVGSGNIPVFNDSITQMDFMKKHPCQSIFSHVLWGLLVVFVGTSVGCGPRDGVVRYPISGNITYDGKPIPAGTICFLPDVTKGNHGAPAFTVIKDGKYDTKIGKSPVGGPHEVVVDGADGIPCLDDMGNEMPNGKPMFEPYSIFVELPKKKGETVDLEVPLQKPLRKKR